jgi:hypothetical protein
MPWEQAGCSEDEAALDALEHGFPLYLSPGSGDERAPCPRSLALLIRSGYMKVKNRETQKLWL